MRTNMGFGKNGKGSIISEHPNQALLTLATETGIILASDEVGAAILERFRLIKTEVVASIQGGVFASTDGPLELILFDGNFTLAEISASILNVGPVGPNETEEEEQTDRFWKSFGLVSFIAEDSGGGALLNMGRVTAETIRWTFARTKGWRWLVFNWGAALTTGSTFKLRAKHFGVWVI